jgi:hypothetical protein
MEKPKIEKPLQQQYVISIESKIHCVNIFCVNNISNSCNLKGIRIDQSGACLGMINVEAIKEKD